MPKFHHWPLSDLCNFIRNFRFTYTSTPLQSSNWPCGCIMLDEVVNTLPRCETRYLAPFILNGGIREVASLWECFIKLYVYVTLHAYNYTVTVAPWNCDAVINYVKFILTGTVHCIPQRKEKDTTPYSTTSPALATPIHTSTLCPPLYTPPALATPTPLYTHLHWLHLHYAPPLCTSQPQQPPLWTQPFLQSPSHLVHASAGSGRRGLGHPLWTSFQWHWSVSSVYLPLMAEGSKIHYNVTCVFMCVLMCVYLCVCTYVCVFMCVFLCWYFCVYFRVFMCVYLCVCTYVCVLMCVYSVFSYVMFHYSFCNMMYMNVIIHE